MGRYRDIILVLGLLTWAYLDLRHAGFIYEDLRWQATASPVPLRWPRSMMHWSWWLQQQYTPDPRAFHAVNLALHVCVVVLAGCLVAQLSGNVSCGLVAGAVYALHPSMTETVVYLSARPELLAATGVLGACLVAAGAWWRPLHALALLLSLVFGLLGKETAALGPLLVALVMWASGSWRAAPRWAQGLAIIVVLLVNVAFIQWWIVRGAWHLGEAPGVDIRWTEWVGLQASASHRSIALWVWPFAGGHTVDYDYDRLTSAMRLTSTLTLVIATAVLTWIARRHRLAAVGLLWCVITIGPRFIVQTPRSVLNDHQLYLPFAGALMIVVAPGAIRHGVSGCA